MNLILATLAALGFHLLGYASDLLMRFVGRNLVNALELNVLLAVFNLVPIPPLDGGRILVGVLPKPLARPLAWLEPYGLIILIGILIVLPLLGAQFDLDLNFISIAIARATNAIIRVILQVTGNG
jgi:Zn-dependent protease